jgi:nicotinamide-nucleotide amidase
MNLKKGIDIISIGDELLIGQVQNTNASWMAELLNQHSLPVNRIIAVSDTPSDIIEILQNSIQSARLVLVTGGLGPTKDDRTKATICNFFESTLILNQEVLAHVTTFFAKRGRALTESNRKQALLPHNCQVVKNEQGTAPGMHFIKEETHFVFMPGVPYEMKGIMNSWVIPYFTSLCNVKSKSQKTILTSGMGESFLADAIADWENNLPANAKLAYLPSPGRVRLRLSIEGESKEETDAQLQLHIDELMTIIPNLVYGYDDDLLEAVVGKLLKAKNKTLALAESCTAGSIAKAIGSIAGCSQYFRGGIVAYHNEVKISALKIDSAIISQHGAVSEAVACKMAENARQLLQADYAISTTGIAGPEGGTDDKPVGTVWIGFASEKKVNAKKFQFGGERDRIINWSVQSALNKLRKELLDEV